MPDAVHWTDYAIQLNYVFEHRKYKAIISIPKTFFAKNVIYLLYLLKLLLQVLVPNAPMGQSSHTNPLP